MSLEVQSPGLLTTVQDLGRSGFRAFGMPLSGALDPFSLAAGNLVVGNGPGAAGLEVTLVGPGLAFRSERLVCVTGGDLSPRVNGRAIPCWEGVLLREGDVLTFGGAGPGGARCWVCVGGGIDTPPVMGSRSTYLRGKLGGYKGRRLEKGDILPLGVPDILSPRGEGFAVPGELRPGFIEGPVVRVIPGPQEGHFTEEGLEVFYKSSYCIDPGSDRMGYRLRGPAVHHREGADIISDAVPWGAVQVPGNGLPIIMMADGQTTGGYPKIAAAISADLGLLAAAAPGDSLSFRRCGLGEAAAASRALKGSMDGLRVLLAGYRSRPVRSVPKADRGALRLHFDGGSFDITWEIIGREDR